METLETDFVVRPAFNGMLEAPLDETNRKICAAIESNYIKAMHASRKPLVGEVVLWPNGEYRRIANDFETAMRTSRMHDGTFFVSNKGQGIFDGHPMPAQMIEFFQATTQMTTGKFWFFSHNIVNGGRPFHCYLPCRVWVLMPYRRSLAEAAVHPRAVECADNWGINHDKYQERIESIMNPPVIVDPANG